MTATQTVFSVHTELSLLLLLCTYCYSGECFTSGKHNGHCVALIIFGSVELSVMPINYRSAGGNPWKHDYIS
jgi:hypothetical protein